MTRRQTFEILSLSQVCARLNLSPGQVRWRVTRGRLPTPLNIPRLGLRWSAKAISRWTA